MCRLTPAVSIVLCTVAISAAAPPIWQPVGLSGGGAMYNPVISPADPKRFMVHCDMSAAYLTEDGGLSWRMVHAAQLRSNTRCRAAFHPTDAKIIYSPHSVSALRVSRDGGIRWEDLARFDDGLVGPLTIDPREPGRMLVGVGKGVRLSGDGGRTWRACEGVAGAFVGAHFAHAAGAVRIFAATGQGIWRSDDGGKTWADPADSRIIYLGLSDANGKAVGGLYRTTDGGASWARLFREGREHFGGYLHPKRPGWIYATLCEDAPTCGLYLSKDNGKTFRPVEGLPFANAMRVTFDPADQGVIYVSTFGGSVWRGPAE